MGRLQRRLQQRPLSRFFKILFVPFPPFVSTHILKTSTKKKPGVSKLASLLAHKALQRHLLSTSSSSGIPPSNTITCIAVHPGAVNTFSHRIPLRRLLEPLVNLFFLSPDDGARNSCFAAAAKEVGENKGRFQGAYLVGGARVGQVSKVAASEAL
jgi:hypothetical protein